MKNFFKKLSFVLASAMVITSLYAPANTSAAAKDGITLKGKVITKKGIFVGGDKINFDYKIGKLKNKGAMGKWSTSDSSVITVDKNGVVTAKGTGEATLFYKVKKNKNVKKNATYKVTLNAMARADKLEISASDKAISLKVGEVKEILPVLTDKVDGVKNTYNLFAKSSDENIATATVKDNMKVEVTAKATNASPATITVFAAQKNNAEEAMNNKYKVEDTFQVTVKAPLEASQVKANKVKVVGNDFSKVTTSGAFTVKDSKGNTLKFKEAVALNPEKTEATLEFETSQIPVEKYTLTFSDMTAEFSAEKAKVAKIDIVPEDEAILVNENTAKVYYKAFDQFGEEVTDTVVGSDIVVSAANATVKKNEITFTGTAPFIPNMSVVGVTVIDKATQVSNSKTLKVGQKDKATKIEFAGIWDKSQRKIVKEIPEVDANGAKNFVLLFTAKNKYDLEIDYSKHGEDLSVFLISATGLSVAPSTANVEFEANGKKYAGYYFNGKVDRPGEVTINAIALFGANTIKPTFNVVPSKKVAKLVVNEGVTGIYANQANDLSYTAYDSNDNIIPNTDWKTLSRMNKGGDEYLKASAGEVRFEKREDGKVYLVYDLSTDPLQVAKDTTSYQPISWKTASNMFDSKIVSVREKRRPVAISRLADKVATGATRTNKLALGLESFLYEDQFGNTMTAKQIAKLYPGDVYKLYVGIPNNTYFAVQSTNGGENHVAYAQDGETITPVITGKIKTFNANGLNAATDDGKALEVQAKNGGDISEDLSYDAKAIAYLGVGDMTKKAQILDDYSFDIFNVRLNDVKNIYIKDIKLKPAVDLDGGADTDTKFEPEVFGQYAGQTIKLTHTSDYVVYGSADQYARAPKKDTLENSVKKTAETTVSVVIKNAAGEKLAKTYQYSVNDRVATTIETVPGFAGIVFNNGTAKTWDTDLKNSFVLKDQYGKVIAWSGDNAPYITISDHNTDITTVANNGLKAATLLVNTNSKDVVTLTLTIPGTSAKLEKMVKVSRGNN